MSSNRYTNDDVVSAVGESISIRQVLCKLGLAPKGGNYKTIKNIIEKCEINTDHFLGRGHNLGKTWIKTPLTDYLNNKKPITSYKLKNRLFKEGLKNEICESCKLDQWLGSKISLELHHINGDSGDNKIENLQILCPNCHSLTPNYRRCK